MSKYKRLIAAVLLPLLTLCIVSANVSRFTWCATDRVAELQENPAFAAAAMQHENRFENIKWYDPVRYMGYFPYMGEVLCVPYLAYDVEDVATAGSSHWQFSVGFLLWDPVTETETTAPALMCRNVRVKLNVTGLNTAVRGEVPGVRSEEHGSWNDPTYTELFSQKKKAAGDGSITVETWAATIDSAVDPNTERRLPIDASFTLYHMGLPPTDSFPMCIGTSGVKFISNVRSTG